VHTRACVDVCALVDVCVCVCVHVWLCKCECVHVRVVLSPGHFMWWSRLHLLCLVSVSSSVPVQLWLNPTTADSCGQNPVLDMCVGACLCL